MSDESTQNRILLAAGPIFAAKGFKSATVREICDAAGVNLASINYYFGDKQNLYLQSVIAAREARAQQYPYPDWDDDSSPEEKLYGFVLMMLNRLVAMQTEQPWQVRLLMREILQPTEVCRQLVEEYFRPVFEQLLLIIDQLANKQLSQDERNKLGFSILGQCIYYRFASELTQMYLGPEEYEHNYTKTALANHICDFSLAAIRDFRSTDGRADRRQRSHHFDRDPNKTERV